jgi:hypothetical protein
MRIPPLDVDTQYNAKAVFTIPKHFLNSILTFFIVGRDENFGSLNAMPNVVAGHSDTVDETLAQLFYSKTKATAYVPVEYEKTSTLYPAFERSKTKIQIGASSLVFRDQEGQKDKSRILEEGSRPGSSAAQRYEEGFRSNLPYMQSIADDKERWKVLSKELAQKQELIHRMVKEIDDKTESLKLTGAEIVDLRR